MAFAQKRFTCIGCKAVLKTDGVCAHLFKNLFPLKSVLIRRLYWLGVLKHLTCVNVICVTAAAVCDFCKKKESELYQKEVTSYFKTSFFFSDVCLKKCLTLGLTYLVFITLNCGGSLEVPTFNYQLYLSPKSPLNQAGCLVCSSVA